MSTMPATKVMDGIGGDDERSVERQLSPNTPMRVYPAREKNWYDRLEAFVSALSVRDNFWHRICSFLWLPFAFYSGIRMK